MPQKLKHFAAIVYVIWIILFAIHIFSYFLSLNFWIPNLTIIYHNLYGINKIYN